MHSTQHTVIRGKQAVTVVHHTNESCVYVQAVNAHTGLPWQARRKFKAFHGENKHAQAMAYWLKLERAAAAAALQANIDAAARIQLGEVL